MFRRQPTKDSDDEDPAEPDAPGWDAIDGALARLYPGVEPIHRAPIPGPAFGGGVQGISAYKAREGSEYWLGHRIDFRGPINGDPACRLTAVTFTEDPQLGLIETPYGGMLFLQVVGITADELAEMKGTSTDAVLSRLARDNPMLTTDVSRA